MVKIRLKRLGRKKRPFYRIVVMDIRERRQGAALAELGYYNPLSRELKVDKKAAEVWISKGAMPSETVEKLLKKAPETGELVVLERFKKERLSKKAESRQKQEIEAKAAAETKAAEDKAAAQAKAAEEKAAAEAPVAEAPAAEAAPAVEAETAPVAEAAPAEEAPAEATEG